jgi:hypothetical protein
MDQDNVINNVCGSWWSDFKIEQKLAKLYRGEKDKLKSELIKIYNHDNSNPDNDNEVVRQKQASSSYLREEPTRIYNSHHLTDLRNRFDLILLELKKRVTIQVKQITKFKQKELIFFDKYLLTQYIYDHETISNFTRTDQKDIKNMQLKKKQRRKGIIHTPQNYLEYKLPQDTSFQITNFNLTTNVDINAKEIIQNSMVIFIEDNEESFILDTPFSSGNSEKPQFKFKVKIRYSQEDDFDRKIEVKEENVEMMIPFVLNRRDYTLTLKMDKLKIHFKITKLQFIYIENIFLDKIKNLLTNEPYNIRCLSNLNYHAYIFYTYVLSRKDSNDILGNKNAQMVKINIIKAMLLYGFYLPMKVHLNLDDFTKKLKDYYDNNLYLNHPLKRIDFFELLHMKRVLIFNTERGIGRSTFIQNLIPKKTSYSLHFHQWEVELNLQEKILYISYERLLHNNSASNIIFVNSIIYLIKNNKSVDSQRVKYFNDLEVPWCLCRNNFELTNSNNIGEDQKTVVLPDKIDYENTISDKFFNISFKSEIDVFQVETYVKSKLNMTKFEVNMNFNLKEDCQLEEI